MMAYLRRNCQIYQTNIKNRIKIWADIKLENL